MDRGQALGAIRDHRGEITRVLRRRFIAQPTMRCLSGAMKPPAHLGLIKWRGSTPLRITHTMTATRSIVPRMPPPASFRVLL